jgi:MFS family permease
MSAQITAAIERPLPKLWQNRPFMVFCTARTVSAAGTGMTMVVLPVLTYRLTKSPGVTAALVVIQALPYLAFGLFAGALADRVDRRRVMVISDVACVLLLGSIPLAAGLHLLTAAQLFVVAFGVATAFVWFDAANFGALAGLVGRSQLPDAAGMVWSSGSIVWLLAPALGASLIVVIAPAYVLGLDALTYLASALLLSSIRRSFQPFSEQEGRESQIRSGIAAGLRFLWHQPVVRTMTLSVFAVCVSWGGTFGLVVIYATRALHLGHSDARLGLLYSAGELGGLIAALVIPKIVKRPSAGRVAAAFMLINVMSLLLLAVAPGYAWAVTLFFCYEFTYTMILTVGITLRQMLTPDHMQGRINTTARLIGYSGQPLGALISGLLAGIWPIRVVFALMTFGVAAGAALAGWSCRRSGPLSVISLSPDR